MSDEERADAFLDFWPPDPFIANTAQARPVLAAEFAAVRLDERERIVAWLLERVPRLGDTHGGLYGSLAERIRRGDHGAGS